MSGTIDASELRVGMYVHLDLGWMSHPFPVGSFRISDEQQIQTIRALGLKRLRWSPERSLAAPACPPPADEHVEPSAPASVALPAAPRPETPRQRLQHEREATARCQQQFDEAGAAWREAHALVLEQPQQARTLNEQLTQALLDKMLATDGELCLRVLAGNAGEHAQAHALNVSILSLLLGRRCGLSEPQLRDLGVGALLHDVGKLDLPHPLRHVEEGASPDRLQAYREHVAHGVAHGRRMGLAPDALLVLAQHHELFDGSGFPQQIKGEQQSPPARIVALVNRYDNLCNPPSLARALTPHEALSLLYTQAQSRFDSQLLNGLIRLLGVYPAGSVVQLSDERYALVTSVNPGRPLKPGILVHDPKLAGEPLLHLDLADAPELGIRRSLKPALLPPDAAQALRARPRVSYFFEPAARPEAVMA